MPPNSDDLALLYRYANDRDEQAFATLVQRHINLVYSAAARRVGDRHLAQDVTQAVFILLARKAKSIRREASLACWLLTTVRYTAANALRMQARRRRHEQPMSTDATPANVAGAASADPSEVIVWQELATHLDDAVLKLPAQDRQAILLRFFENRPLHDIAVALDVTENTAKQRVSRAVDKLRQRLLRTDMALSLSPGAFSTLLAHHVIRSAPPALVQSTCAAAIGGAGSASSIAIAKGASHMLTVTKAKIAAGFAVAILATGGLVSLNHAGAEPQKTPDAVDPVIADAPPVIISTIPQAGATDIDPNLTEIKVTFSKDMRDHSWSWVRTDEHFPKMAGEAHYLSDHRTCVLPVKLEPGMPYSLWLNNITPSNFTDTHGHAAVAYMLVFQTRK